MEEEKEEEKEGNFFNNQNKMEGVFVCLSVCMYICSYPPHHPWRVYCWGLKEGSSACSKKFKEMASYIENSCSILVLLMDRTYLSWHHRSTTMTISTTKKAGIPTSIKLL